MGTYTKDSEELLKLVGGKENIAAVSHCMTRMRFVLVDPKKADVKKIEAMKVVKGSFTQAGQFQVIIGNTVSEFYKDFTAFAGIEGVSKDAVKAAAGANQNVLQRAAAIAAEIFAPLIPAIITGGLILGFRNCIDSLYLFENGTKTLVQLSQFWAGMDHFLWLIGEAVFHLGIPVGICWSVVRKMGGTPILGIVLGLTLVSSQLLNAYAVATTPADQIPHWDFGNFQVNMIGYQAQVIPAILAALVLVQLERLFKSFVPPVVSMIVVPFCSLLLTVIAAHFVLGPIGWKIGSAISSVVFSGITGDFRVIFGAIFGFIYAPLVITGLHHMTNAIDLQLIADYGGTMLWPMIALSNIAQGSAVLGMMYLQRKNAQAQEINVPAWVSCWLGVTEPAIFGVNIPRLFPLICGMTGSACAAIICVSTNTTANAIGVGGVPGILSIQPQYMPTFALAMLAAIVVPVILTMAVGKKRGVDKEAEAAQAAAEAEAAAEAANAEAEKNLVSENEFKAYLDGEVISLKEIGDGVFSEKMVGDGLAIKPANETVCAPVSGKVTVLMEDSKHAVGMTLSNGVEILIHVGIDTVSMGGDGFSYLVKVGDVVKVGTPLLKFSKAKIKAAGHPDTAVFVVTNPNGVDFKFNSGMKAKTGQTVIASY
ncbi:MAG: PTS system trehalose-specific EIIBC component [Selenomonadaceae bacterium]|nr:PTS system trehalose-specific EIIBC component [Selenomonadaceae bacterium]